MVAAAVSGHPCGERGRAVLCGSPPISLYMIYVPTRLRGKSPGIPERLEIPRYLPRTEPRTDGVEPRTGPRTGEVPNALARELGVRAVQEHEL